MSKGQLLVGLKSIILVAFVGAVVGAIIMATTALIVSGSAYFTGFITMNTAQNIILLMVAGGALLGIVGGIALALFTGATV